ncbi:hypothetical protein G9A89_007490 [Geosiphon pyriformis]|nr:hypothetical protein G9A89_007490 [Geosiphon pyriformis]
MLNWMTQELVLSQNDQHTRVPAMCGHFKPSNVKTTTLFIEFEEEENKPMWKAYQSALDDRNNEESGTINYVLHVELSYLTKECGITFLSGEEHEEELISSCASESELIFNPDSNSNNNDDENTSFSSIQYGDNNDNDSNSDLNPNSDYEQYIALSDLTKKQELKWFSDNNKGIMPDLI